MNFKLRGNMKEYICECGRKRKSNKHVGYLCQCGIRWINPIEEALKQVELNLELRFALNVR